MKSHRVLIFTLALTVFLALNTAAAQPPFTLDLGPDAQNPEAPRMGNHLRFWSTITNTGATPVEGLVAWISLVEIDPGHEQPMDLKDWSAQNAIGGVSLAPGQSLRTNGICG